MQKKRQRGRAGCTGRRAGIVLLLLLGVLLAGAARPARAKDNDAELFCFPLQTAQFRVSDPYGWREDPLTGKEAFHRGVDLACAEGTPVLAALNGTVTAARRSATYGNYLCISHAAGQETLYAHMQYLYVRAGEIVQVGECIGTAGQTGRATGAHLHFELLENGARQDPAAALGLP